MKSVIPAHMFKPSNLVNLMKLNLLLATGFMSS